MQCAVCLALPGSIALRVSGRRRERARGGERGRGIERERARESERESERERGREGERERERERCGLKIDRKQVPCGSGDQDFEKNVLDVAENEVSEATMSW